ncbi:MAG: UDP-2,4-diacetamido-2,4,6-trideoxy-beta-L-altropyranose hydrolase [Chloroflexota bacterium]
MSNRNASAVEHNYLVIRADSSARMGTGHIMRCLALAQTWQDAGKRVMFMMAMEAPALAARLTDEGFEVIFQPVEPGSLNGAEKTAALARKMGAAWVVVDGYHFGAEYQKVIHDAGLCLLFIDDYGHADHYYADLVLNQNIYANDTLYPEREGYTGLLLGTQFALLRREFKAWRGWQREIPTVARKILVTLGGSDPDNTTLKVIQALQQLNLPDLEARVVVGPSNVYLDDLRQQLTQTSCNIELLTTVTEMTTLMSWADLAISAGGSTSWELAFMGLPIVSIVLAENQKDIAAGLDAAGMAINLGWHANITSTDIAHAMLPLIEDEDRRREMSQRARTIVDGLGAQRVVDLLGMTLHSKIGAY